MKRSSGILMPLSSLPSNYGIGTLGDEAYKFVDFLKAAGQKYWQVLPLGPTSYGDSPYSSFSTYAGNPYFVDLDRLVKAGLLTQADLEGINWGTNPEYVDYGKLYESRYIVLRKAFDRADEDLLDAVKAFRKENGEWIENYALYMAVKASFGMVSWLDWPDRGIRVHEKESVEEYSLKLSDDVDFWVFLQYLFFEQWNELKDYARANGIAFIGDVPIYVALDSADVWADPGLFMLDEENRPIEVAGVPPDAFTEDGQLWGNPLYNWDVMRADGYGWWIRRIGGAGKLFDVIRIDHFRGFESYWAVPAGNKTAKNGVWRPGPGLDLVNRLVWWYRDTDFIAEDLGVITPGVRAMVEGSGLPGMKVMEFGFDPNGDSDYMPHNIELNSVCYIGTHDNSTIGGWLGENTDEVLSFAAEYMHRTSDESWQHALLRTGMSTASKLFIMQMQDVLELPGYARMNTPGTAIGNWQWRMLPGAASKELAARVKAMTLTYRRTELELPEKAAEAVETEE